MKLQALISHLEPKLGSISKIGHAVSSKCGEYVSQRLAYRNKVKHTVDDYVKFLESVDAKVGEVPFAIPCENLV